MPDKKWMRQLYPSLRKQFLKYGEQESKVLAKAFIKMLKETGFENNHHNYRICESTIPEKLRLYMAWQSRGGQTVYEDREVVACGRTFMIGCNYGYD